MKKIPKALQLLHLLTQQEVTELKERLEKGNRHRLLKLTDLLNELGDQSPDKKSTYEHIFDEEYASDKDYLLRNEYRLLCQQIQWLLAEVDAKEQMEQQETLFHFHLLEAFQKRNALDLFQKEYSSFYKQALDYQDYYNAYNISELNFIHFTRFQNLKEKDIAYLEKLNELGLKHLNSYYLTAFRQHQINHQYISSNFFPYSTEGIPPEKEVVVDFETYKTDFSNYLFLKAKSFIVPLEEQNNILQQCLERAKHQFAQNHLMFQEEVQFCLSALAKNRSQLAHFMEANKYYQEYFEIYEEIGTPQFVFVMGDYIANFINLNEFDKAIELLTEHKSVADSIPKMRVRWQCLLTACYAFTENNKKLENCLLAEIEFPNSTTKYFFRFYYAIYALLDNRAEDAYREMENMRHLKFSHKDNDEIMHISINFFHRYFYNILHHPTLDKSHQNNEQHLKEDISKFVDSAFPEIRSYLPLLWLKRKLENAN